MNSLAVSIGIIASVSAIATAEPVDVLLFPREAELSSTSESLIGPVALIDGHLELDETYRITWMIVGEDFFGDQYEFTVGAKDIYLDDRFYFSLDVGYYLGFVELERKDDFGTWEVVASDFIEFDVTSVGRHVDRIQ